MLLLQRCNHVAGNYMGYRGRLLTCRHELVHDLLPEPFLQLTVDSPAAFGNLTNSTSNQTSRSPISEKQCYPPVGSQCLPCPLRLRSVLVRVRKKLVPTA